MSIVQQRTIKNPINCRGVGLHSGVKTSLILHPAAPDSGIIFRRTDASGAGAEIPARWRNAVESALCTTLSNGEGTTIGTVEHLMAALAGSEIDNVLVELDGPEVPIMDGSAAPFVFLIECAGVVEQDAPRQAIRILKTVTVGDDEKSASLMSDDGFSMSFEIDFASRAVSQQDLTFVFDSETFKAEISRARTFGFLHEVDRMRAVVVSGDTILNEGGLRYADEFVRHKLLDSLGDLYLAGAPIIGHFRGLRSGHLLNRKLLEALFATPDAWCMTTLSRADTVDSPMWRERSRASA